MCRLAIGRRIPTEAIEATMKTIHWAAAPPPAAATIAAITAAMAIGPRKKATVTISPTASAPAAIIHQTQSSIVDSILGLIEDRPGEVVRVERPQILERL